MGAESLKTIQLTGYGSIAGIGQNISPNEPWPLVRMKSYTRQIDLDAMASNAQAVRIQNNVETPQNFVIPANAPWATQADIWVTPYGFLKGALANPVTLRTETLKGTKYNVVGFTLQGKYKVEGYITENNMVERVKTWVDNDVLGDMVMDAYYTDYKDYSGLKVPTFFTVRQGGFPTLVLGVNDVKANVPVNIPPAPAAAAAAPVTVTSEKIADGVYYLMGGTHHSVLVEFSDHVTLIEAPLNEARALALLAKAKELYPNKPLTQVINTHHHFDHSGGLRAIVDAGLPIVTNGINQSFYETSFSNSRTLNPDRLEQSKKKPILEVVGDEKVISDATRRLELHLIKPNVHNEGIMMAFLPKEKILIEVDLYNPPAAGAPAPTEAQIANASALLTNVEQLRLDFDTILPLHGPGKVRRADLYAYVKKPLVPVSALPDPKTLRAVAAPAPPLPAPETGDDAAIAAVVNKACVACHNFDRVNAKHDNQAAWQGTVARMKMKGASITDEQVALVSDFLSRILPR